MSSSAEVQPESTSRDTVPVPVPPPKKRKLTPIVLGDATLSDVVLVVDEQEFHVNKTILANRSDVFKKMFFGEPKEAQSDLFPIPGLRVSTFLRLLELVYNGSISDADQFLALDKNINSKDCLADNYKSSVGVIMHFCNKRRVVDFWKCVGQLLAAADSLKMGKVVLDYLQMILSLDICCTEQCRYCLNYWIFAEYHGLDLSLKHRTFNGVSLKNWMEGVRSDLSCKVPMDYVLLERLLAKTGQITRKPPTPADVQPESTSQNTVPVTVPTSEADKPDPIQFGDSGLSDVVLVVDHQEFHVNKTILAYRSDVFKAMFFGSFKEAKDDRVEIKEVPVDGFRRLLELLHNGSISDRDKFLFFQRDMSEKESIASTHTSTRSAIVHLVPERKRMASFWTCIGELLVVADRFNLEKVVLEYLKEAIVSDVCCKEDCPVCLNHWIFAEQHGLDVEQKHRTFGGETLDAWFDAIGPDPGCTIPMDFPLMEKILTKTGKI